jgi:hypothetical protein
MGLAQEFPGLIRDRVAFVSAYAPFSSMLTFARDIASASIRHGELREPWKVDQLTRKVFVQSMTAWLQPAEADSLRLFATDGSLALEAAELSEEGQAVYRCWRSDRELRALQHLPEAAEKLTALFHDHIHDSRAAVHPFT